jgi:hypothetical protein
MGRFPALKSRTKDDDEYPGKPGAFFGCDVNTVASAKTSSQASESFHFKASRDKTKNPGKA